MAKRLGVLCVAVLLCGSTSPFARQAAPGARHGSLTIHLILHTVGTEEYDLATNADGTRTLTTTFDYSDRGNRRTTAATLTTTADDRPMSLEIKSNPPTTVTWTNGAMTSSIRGASRTTPASTPGAAVMGASPFALQMMMLRAWHARGEPKQLALVSPNASPEPLEIARVGTTLINVDGKSVTLERYTVNHLMFGREVLWTTPDGDLAAAMTFAGGLPMEAVRTSFEPALTDLYRAGVAQEMADLDAIGREVKQLAASTFAITNVTLIDATGAAPVPDAVVVVRNNRIVSAGARASVTMPRGVQTIDGHGQTLLPGLWEMHTHASGIEFGPAHLGAGITTVRDCGGEFDYLVAVRDAIEKKEAIGPRTLMAGLIDAGGARAFGHVTAETPDEGRAAVDKYHAAGFEQIKLYTYLAPDVIAAITAEAHKLGMTVTGHVPQSVTTMQGIEAGMDQINHLQYITSMLRTPTPAGQTGRGGGAIDLQSGTAKSAIQFLLDHHTVVDPTASWGEMGSHSRDVDVAAFEPGILKAPAVLDAKFRGMESATPGDQWRARTAQSLTIVEALHKAGVPVVAGSDTGLVGWGLHREVELYVQAGFTPMEAIQSATIVPAHAMGLDRDTGTIEAGKRADLILVDGDPLKDILALRNVTRVVTNGRMYDAGALWQSVGFKR